VQFLSGGWVERNLPSNHRRKSNTYIFPNDVLSTLLQMAGGDPGTVHSGKAGAPYGNALWNYIRNSVTTDNTPETPHQLVRKVSYGPDWFFDVQQDKVLKHFYTGDTPMLVPRLYEPIWPKDGDLVMDTTYLSVQPCRPNGKPSNCCSLNIHHDWQERVPLEGDCDDLRREAQNLFEIEGGCPRDSSGRHLNRVCHESGDVRGNVSPAKLALWSHLGAAGPFVNSHGQPIGTELPMKCICRGLLNGTSADDVDYFTVGNLGQSLCGKSKFGFRPLQTVACDGTFALGKPPTDAILAGHEREGYDMTTYNKILLYERHRFSMLVTPEFVSTMVSYTQRSGNHTEWPAMGKFPFHGIADTCKAKGVSNVPFMSLAITPYIPGTPDPSVPWKNLAPFLGLCTPFTATKHFCASHQNAVLKPVVEWHIDRHEPYGTFDDGTKWMSMSWFECVTKCKREPLGTAYIGDGPHGLVV
jgi:hypothetical protein